MIFHFRFGTAAAACFLLFAVSPAVGQRADMIPGLRARIIPVSSHVPIGQPIRVTFAIENTTDEAVTLTVPGTTPQFPAPEVGLPISHIFSSGSSPSITVVTQNDRRWSEPLGYRAPAEAPILIVAPHSIVGTAIDLREYFPTLRSSGRFGITWTPYKGAIEQDSVYINVAPRRVVEIVTDVGTLKVRLFFDAAPSTVANFLELVRDGFYNGTVFHRIEPGHYILGGCQHGDGTGIRPDGKRVSMEINNQKHERGTIAMALLDDDPESGSSQFFICNTREQNFDGRYTVFGKLFGDESYATLDALMSTTVDQYGQPQRRLYIRSSRTVTDTEETKSMHQ